MATEKHTPPEFRGNAFHCPHCGVYAHQHWGVDAKLYFGGRYEEIRGFALNVSVCHKCKKECLWFNGELIFPDSGSAPPPNSDMPPDIAGLYMEAGKIEKGSHRAAAALLRLALEQLCDQLGAEGSNLYEKINSLELEDDVSEAMHAVRGLGNKAAHSPGQIDLNDHNSTAAELFEVINYIVDDLITRPKKKKEKVAKIKKLAEEKDG